jgi:hypothetical protein
MRARTLLELYPPDWRRRYGDEIVELVGDRRLETNEIVDLLRGALGAHLRPVGAVPEGRHQTVLVARRAVPLLPPLMSLTALIVVALHVAASGTAHGGDEGTAAHLWQIVMAAQLPLVLATAVDRLRLGVRPTVAALAVQLTAWLAAAAPVALLHL